MNFPASVRLTKPTGKTDHHTHASTHPHMTKREEAQTNLGLIGHGELLDEVQGAFLDGEKALAETGKAYELTIKIKVALASGRKRVVTHEVKTKLPKAGGTATYIFVNDAGQLMETDPDQKLLPLQVVDKPKAPLQQAAGSAK